MATATTIQAQSQRQSAVDLYAPDLSSLKRFKDEIIAQKNVWKGRLVTLYGTEVTDSIREEFRRALETRLNWSKTWSQLQRKWEEKSKGGVGALAHSSGQNASVEKAHREATHLFSEIPVELEKADRRLETFAKYVKTGHVEWWITSAAKNKFALRSYLQVELDELQTEKMEILEEDLSTGVKKSG